MTNWLSPISEALAGNYKNELTTDPLYAGGLAMENAQAPVIGNNFWSAFLPQVGMGAASGLAMGYGKHKIKERQNDIATDLATYAGIKDPTERASFAASSPHLKELAPQLQVAELGRATELQDKQDEIGQYLAKQGIDPTTGQASPWVSNLTAAQAAGRATAAGPRNYTSYENGQRVTKQSKFNQETGEWEDRVVGTSPQVPNAALSQKDSESVTRAMDTSVALQPLLEKAKQLEAQQKDTGPILTAIQAKIMGSIPGADWNLIKTVFKAEGKKAAVSVFGSGTGLSEKEGDIIMDLIYDPGAIGKGQLSPRLENLITQAYNRATDTLTPRIMEKQKYSEAAQNTLEHLYKTAPQNIRQAMYPKLKTYGVSNIEAPDGSAPVGGDTQYNQAGPPQITDADKAAHPGMKFQWSPSLQKGRWVPL